MVKFRWKFTLTIMNILIVLFAYCWLPVSSLVMVASIPAIVYSIYSKKLFLSVITVAMFFLFYFLFWLGIINPTELIRVFENGALIFYLYTKIYPYEIDISLISVLNIDLIFWLSIFIFFIIIFSYFSKINEFTMMLSFSYFLLLFSSVYLLFNVFLYLIPPLKVLLFSNVVSAWVFLFLYLIFPFVSLVLTMLFVELSIISIKDRHKYEKIDKIIKKKKSRHLSTVLSIIAIAIIGVIISIIIFGLILI